jgi:hypothetical protein
MSEHLFGLGESVETIGHAHSEMFTDPHGHLLSTVHTAADGSTTFTDASGMQVGTAVPTPDGVHVTNAAGQEVAHISHDVLYDSSNLPIATFTDHENLTNLADLQGKPIGHILRTPDGGLMFDGAPFANEVGFSTKW